MNVLEVMSRCADELQRQHMTSYAIELDEARKVVGELIEAFIESRRATQEFANDGQPENYVRWVESERRAETALARIGGAP